MGINEHIVRLDRKVGEKTSDMYQWDTGQKFVFDKDDILVGTEVQFDDGSVKVISNKSVEIPDSLLKTSGEKKCWVQIIGSNHETTSYCITFDVIKRQKKNDYIEPANTSTFRSEMQTLLNAKQNTLTAGENITISGNIISANSTTNIPSWALQTNKPTYTASEVGALPATTVIPTVPTKVSAFENDSGYLTQHQDISGKQNVIPDLESIRSKANSAVQDISSKQDKLTAGENIVINGSVISAVSNDVPDWAMEPNKPTYTASEVGALPSDTVIPVVPTKVSAFENDSGYLTQHQDISVKQDKIEDLEEIRNKANSALQEHQDISGKQDVIFDLDDIRSKANSALQTHVDISGKVDKVTGKGLSENDYTNADKAKVSAIPENPKYTDTVYDDSGVLGDIADLQEADEYTIHYDPDVDEAGSEDAVPYSEYTQKISQLESSISGNSSGITSEASARSSADAAIRQDLVNKLDAPSSPLVGKYLKISQVNADGSVVLENVDLPIATPATPGVVIPTNYYGFNINTINGQLKGLVATKDTFTTRNDSYVISKGTLNNVLASPSIMPSLSDTEKLAARQRIGAVSDAQATHVDTEVISEATYLYNCSFDTPAKAVYIHIKASSGMAIGYIYIGVNSTVHQWKCYIGSVVSKAGAVHLTIPIFSTNGIIWTPYQNQGQTMDNADSVKTGNINSVILYHTNSTGFGVGVEIKTYVVY